MKNPDLHPRPAIRGSYIKAGAGLLVFFLAGLACFPVRSGNVAAGAYEESIRHGRNERHQSLLQPDGWLTLVGLHWLPPGVNTIGSAADNDVVLPEQAPAHVGVVQVELEQAVFTARAGVEVRHRGQPVREIVLAPDITGEPTVLELGSLSFYLIDREGERAIRVKDRESPALRDFPGLDYFPVDPHWRLTARFEPNPEPKELPVPTTQGPVQHITAPGALAFEIEGTTYRLDVIGEPGSRDLFIIFGDATNGKETYGGGRFLEAALPDEEGKPVILDFNQAYNPPCVFTPYATCPLPPPQNKLPVRVEAGEKTYHGNY